MTNKPTDADIIKALECCINADCLNCPRWSEEWSSGMCNDFLQSVLDLINHYQAENEDLEIKLKHFAEFLAEAEKKNEELKTENEALNRLLDRMQKENNDESMRT